MVLTEFELNYLYALSHFQQITTLFIPLSLPYFSASSTSLTKIFTKLPFVYSAESLFIFRVLFI